MTMLIGRMGLRGVLAGMALMAGVSGARAADLCQLATADTFAKASSVLEASGCSVASEDGTRSRAFTCEGGGWAQLQDSGMISIVMPGSVLLQASGRCGGENWTRATAAYDNPLVQNVFRLGSSYMPDAQIAIISLDQKTPFLNWICTGKYSCMDGAFERGLKTVLEKYLGDDTLHFNSSEIRVAGVDITTATRTVIERELAGRGAALTSHEGGPLISRSAFDHITGVPGLSTIELAYLGDRVTTVRYPIPGDSDFAGMVQSLNERYGVSSPVAGKTCTVRTWKNGGVAILGELCATKPEKSGFTFVNAGAATIVEGLEQLTSKSLAPQAKAQPKAKTDMY